MSRDDLKFRGASGDYWAELNGEPVIWYDTSEEWREAARRHVAGDVVLRQNSDGSWSPAVPESYYRAPLWRRVLGKAGVISFLALCVLVGLILSRNLWAWLKETL